MALQGIQEQNAPNQVLNPVPAPRQSRCISFCRQFAYIEPVDDMPPARCVERLRGGLSGLYYGFVFGTISLIAAMGTKNAIELSGVSICDEVISKIYLTIFGTACSAGTAFGIVHPDRTAERFRLYFQIDNVP
jgi:hypothetical protein